MGYKRRPIYTFDDENSIGLDKIPNGSKVVIKNYEGKPKEFTKEDSAIPDGYTVAQVINDVALFTGNSVSATTVELMQVSTKSTKLENDALYRQFNLI